MRIAIITDAWEPQVNGVVTTLKTTQKTLNELGHAVEIFGPNSYKSIPCPSYPEIRLALKPKAKLARSLTTFKPEAIHIATEGPMGLAARSICKKNHWPFTTSYHTQFPEYIRARAPIPLKLSYAFFRWFHSAAKRTMVGTQSQEELLQSHGFKNLVRWPRGVDTNIFTPGDKSFLNDPRPIWSYVGRVSVEKNIESYLKLDLPGTKYVIGDGPAFSELSNKYNNIKFVGYKFDKELAQYIAASDVFVFPSKTDTFGIVMLEAMACGVPIAAYPVTGPIDVVRNNLTGCLHDDLKTAAENALKLDPKNCIAQAAECTWNKASMMFLNHTALI
jgi:glycosyltransferase involved in cell wall biosynthesis